MQRNTTFAVSLFERERVDILLHMFGQQDVETSTTTTPTTTTNRRRMPGWPRDAPTNCTPYTVNLSSRVYGVHGCVCVCMCVCVFVCVVCENRSLLTAGFLLTFRILRGMLCFTRTTIRLTSTSATDRKGMARRGWRGRSVPGGDGGDGSVGGGCDGYGGGGWTLPRWINVVAE